jgi:hypothetical protein
MFSYTTLKHKDKMEMISQKGKEPLGNRLYRYELSRNVGKSKNRVGDSPATPGLLA